MNPLPVHLIIDSITISTEGVKVLNYPQHLVLRRQSGIEEYTAIMRPLEKGILKIKGVIF